LAIDASGCGLLGATGSRGFWISPLLGMEMKNQTILFDDEMGRSLIVYRTGISAWSYSVSGKSVGKTFLTRGRAFKAAKKAGYCVSIGVKKTQVQ
jgi:hypothetical protein